MSTKTLKELYTRTKAVEREILTLQEDLKELKNEFLFDKEYNKDGFPKEDVNSTMKAAKSKVKEEDLAGKVAELEGIVDIQDQYED